jgi:hypothetical protein
MREFDADCLVSTPEAAKEPEEIEHIGPARGMRVSFRNFNAKVSVREVRSWSNFEFPDLPALNLTRNSGYDI